ncbi:MAG: hypothetical protein KatS3mg016_1794 [Fimbriimonadales bacterium]|nr:MAG: hypothetical protein KatS3mg016_1794 [Fimbriimonadales bacterium]
MRKTLRMSETLSELAPMLLVLISLLTIAAVSFGRTPPIQTDSRPVSLFKVAYGEKPTQLRVRFPGSRLISEENGDELREPLPGGGPTTFCVSWDGNWFYYRRPSAPLVTRISSYPTLKQRPRQKTDQHGAVGAGLQSAGHSGCAPYKLKHGDPTPECGWTNKDWLYVDRCQRSAWQPSDRPDGTYDKQRTEAVGEADQTARDQQSFA